MAIFDRVKKLQKHLWEEQPSEKPERPEQTQQASELDRFKRDVELGEKLLRKQGYVLIYSHLLKETVAIVRDESVLGRIPKHIVAYSPDEIRALKRGVDAGDITEEGLKLIHQAKKALDARIIR